jgi:transporter family-2 protein
MHLIYYAVGLFLGLAIASQAAINHQLKMFVEGSTQLASLISFIVGSIFLALLCLLSGQRFAVLSQLQQVEWWMLLGGVLGAIFVFGTTFLAPHLGMAVMLSLIISGQITMSLILDQFGLFGLAQRDINWSRLIGVTLVLIGTFCVNFGNR